MAKPHDWLLFEANPSGRLAEHSVPAGKIIESFLHFREMKSGVLYKREYLCRISLLYYKSSGAVCIRTWAILEFTYGDLTLSSAQMTDEDILTVSLKVKNSGKTEGKEVVQLYVADLCGTPERPVKEIERICQSSSPAGKKTVSMKFRRRNLSIMKNVSKGTGMRHPEHIGS